MKRSAIYQTSIIGTGLILMCLYSNCSKVEFKDVSVSAPIVADQGREKTEYDFESTLQPSQKRDMDLDIVWVIDNSGSMTEEIAHVRANLDRFIDSVGSESDLHMAVISKEGTGELDVNMKGKDKTRFLQIDQEVSSVNALLLAGSTLCQDTQGVCKIFANSKLQGRLRSFLRPNSRKVFVIVSDDESQIPPEIFSSVFKQTLADQKMTVFGFVGLGDQQSPCQTKTGASYIQLAQQTKGQTYNICDDDWSSTFSTLAESILSLNVPVVALPHSTRHVELMTVTLNGQPLAKDQYQLTTEGLVINSDLLKANQEYKVKVHYRLN